MMLKLNEELLDYLSELSRIGLNDSEKEKILIDLKKIISFFEELQEVDTNNTEPTYTIFSDLASPLREDVVGTTMPREDLLKNAPSSLGGLITIPPLFG